MKKINIKKTNLIFIALSIILGVILGALIFSDSKEENNHDHVDKAETIWTCSMHPQIRMKEAGLCPICSMELIPLVTEMTSNNEGGVHPIQLSKEAIKLADIQTVLVKKRQLKKTIPLFGKVVQDQRREAVVATRFGGRIEELNINFIGQQVKAGEVLGIIYSPQLISAQQELIEAFKLKDINPRLFEITKEKIKLLGIDEKQINAMLKEEKTKINFEIKTLVSGIVTQKKVALGDYVKEGSIIAELVDLSKVWVLFEAYERDLPHIQIGDTVKFATNIEPDKNYTAQVSYIDPEIDPKTRIVNIRVEFENKGYKLKPEMFVKGQLVAKKNKAKKQILIPASAVLWTGKRSIVYVKEPKHEVSTFTPRQIILGEKNEDMYVVEKGLVEGERIVSNGTFKVDASAQLQGKISMMNPQRTETDNNETGAESQKRQVNEKFKVAGNCELCKKRIENSVKNITGVSFAVWDVNTKMINISFDRDATTLEKIHKAIAKNGHDSEKVRSNDEAYENLPACCQFERDFN